MSKDRAETNAGWLFFLNSGIDYYVAGRYAVFAGLLPTSGNLLHHAVEMFMKGALGQQGRTLAGLYKLSHRLPDIWDQFKTSYPGCSLDGFDPIIRELNKFENIRYPDEIAKSGMSCRIGPGKRPQNAEPAAPGRYELYLGEIDELMGKLFSVAQFNIVAFTKPLKPTAKKYLYEQNQVFVDGEESK